MFLKGIVAVSFGIILVGSVTVRAKKLEDEDVNRRLGRSVVKSIQGEDGDITDCTDIYKQPAFMHPALRNHTIQMKPSDDTSFDDTETTTSSEGSKLSSISQPWQRNGSCPEGTIPVRRMRDRDVRTRKMASHFEGRTESRIPNVRQTNHSVAILITAGYNYNGAKADVRVWNPYVESDDEWSNGHIAMKNGPYYDYESVESGWMVNPGLYGDRQTRLFVYWTLDSSKTTGCFDLTCPGFVQTSNEIALGAAIYPVSTMNGAPYQITLYIFKDLITANFWVQFEDGTNVGYWPAELFSTLTRTVETVQWGGEVYSSRVGVTPHTSTQMGSGQFPNWTHDTSGSMKRVRIRDNSLILKFPEWVETYTDEYGCYNTYYISEYLDDPMFFYGGPGRGFLCP